MAENAIEYDPDIKPYPEVLPKPGDSRVWVTEENIADHFNDQWWRLNNLYQILPKKGPPIRFEWNYEQTSLWHNLWFRNVLLKGRQFGGTTAIDVFELDTALFNANHNAGIIAHTREDAAKIFATKVAFPYDSLHPALRSMVQAETDSKSELAFSNGSSIRVGTSMRSGTLQQLHVSELGKVAAKHPEKAREIMTGAVEAVPDTGTVVIESTAEGRGGRFYDICETARLHLETGRPLANLNYRFHFYTWWHHVEYTADPDFTVIEKRHRDYFKELAGHGIRLTDNQMAWYVQKEGTLGEDMKREYPSYPQEAFEAAHEGSIFGRTMTMLRRSGRIGKVPWNEMFPVSTLWDLGLNDMMAVWYVQQVGRDYRLIDYDEGTDQGWSFWAKQLMRKPYAYDRHYMPHDIGRRDLGERIEKRIDIARRVGIRPVIQVARPRNPEEKWTQIDTARTFLSQCAIDEENCAKGIKHLDAYHKKWDDVNATYMKEPVHDASSNCADALRTGAVGWRDSDPLGGGDDDNDGHTPDY